MSKETVELDVGWATMEKALTKLKRILEGDKEQFTAQEHMASYTIIYNMCVQRTSFDYSDHLHERYKGAIATYIDSTVIPSLSDKSDEFLLREITKRWQNHKLMVKWLSRFFNYLDRYYVPRKAIPPLHDAGMHCFRDLVHKEFKGKVTDVVITLINLEREDDLIDKSLLKEIVDMYIELGMGDIICCKEDFEEHMLADAMDYYSRKASQWIVEDSCPDYMIKTEESLKKEKARVSHYLHSSTEEILMKKVVHQLVSVHYKELLHKENSGFRALLRDEKMEDLSRMNRLFEKVPGGLQQLATTFKQHVSDEGMALVKQADDAMSNKELVAKIVELRERYLVYLNDCFARGSLFDEALKEAFESFCNKVVGGCTSAEMLASYCDDVLKKGAAEKLSSEATEGSLDKAVSLLTYINDKDLFAEFYRKKLSRRLLFDRNTQDDHERFVLSKLKQMCGGHFTSKLEAMVTDMTLQKEKQKQFQQYLSDTNTNLGLDLS